MVKNSLTTRSRLAVFLAVAFTAAYALDIPGIRLLRESTRDPQATLLLEAVLVARMFTPLLGALVVLGIEGRLREWLRALHVVFPGLGAMTVSGLLVILVLALSLGVGLLLGVSIEPCPLLRDLIGGGWAWIVIVTGMLLVGLVVGITFNMVVALGEETGWRGLLLDTLSRGYGEPLAAGLVGVIWGLWHAPLIWAGYNYSIIGCGGSGGGPSAVVVFTSLTTGMGMVLAWLRYRYNSVMAPAAAHGTMNAVAGLFALAVSGPRLVAPPTGISGAIAAGVVGLVLWLVYPPVDGRGDG